MPGTLLRLDSEVNITSRRKSLRPSLLRGFQPAQRRLVAEVDLGVALVAGDHEAVPVGLSANSCSHSDSGITAPVGLPGEHT